MSVNGQEAPEQFVVNWSNVNVVSVIYFEHVSQPWARLEGGSYLDQTRLYNWFYITMHWWQWCNLRLIVRKSMKVLSKRGASMWNGQLVRIIWLVSTIFKSRKRICGMWMSLLYLHYTNLYFDTSTSLDPHLKTFPLFYDVDGRLCINVLWFPLIDWVTFVNELPSYNNVQFYRLFARL